MKYMVRLLKPSLEEDFIKCTGIRHAMKVASDEARAHPRWRVYIAWFRESDGQQGYLNRNGDHEIVGEAWR